MLTITDNKIVRISAKAGYDGVGQEGIVADELLVEAMIGYKTLINHLKYAKDKKKVYKSIKDHCIELLKALEQHTK